MKISMTVEGRTETIYPDGWSDQTGSRNDVIGLELDGNPTGQLLDVNEMLAEIAKLVPAGTKIRVTIETL